MAQCYIMGLDGVPRPPNLACGFGRSRRDTRLRRQRKKDIAALVAIVLILIITLPSVQSAILPGTHSITIERVAGSEDELDAIMAAEGMDFASVLGIARLGRSSHNGFRWSNFTNGETIEFYKGIIKRMDRSWDQNDAALKYVAECQQVDRVLLFPNYDSYEGPTAFGAPFTLVSSHADADFEGIFRFMDLDPLPKVGGGYFMEDAYIIRQHLTFDLKLSDEYHLIIEQLVILDGDHTLMLLMSDPEHHEIFIDPIGY